MNATKIRMTNSEGRWTFNRLICTCGMEHSTRGGDVHCGCGRIYNCFGQQLDYQAVMGCRHVRAGGDCDCGSTS